MECLVDTADGFFVGLPVDLLLLVDDALLLLVAMGADVVR